MSEYRKIELMIKLTGAQVVGEVTSSTDVVISLK